MKHLCILLIRFYRKRISPLKKSPCCRFTPSCSAYALEAFEKRGFFVGLALTVWRILRCNPYCKGGYDPVPETGFRYKGPRVMPVTDDTRREDDGGGCGHCHGEQIASCREAGEASASDETSIQRKEKNQ